MDINPCYHHAYDNLGNGYVQLENFEGARDAFLNALLYKKEYAEAKTDLAILFLHPGNKNRNRDTAEDHFKQALSMAKNEAQKKKLIKQFEDFKASIQAD